MGYFDWRPDLFGLKQSNVHESLLDTLLSSEDLCSFNTVVVVDHPGVCFYLAPALASPNHVLHYLATRK